MVTDVNYIYCGDHFIICTNIESCYIPESNIMSVILELKINKSKKEP